MHGRTLNKMNGGAAGVVLTLGSSLVLFMALSCGSEEEENGATGGSSGTGGATGGSGGSSGTGGATGGSSGSSGTGGATGGSSGSSGTGGATGGSSGSAGSSGAAGSISDAGTDASQDADPDVIDASQEEASCGDTQTDPDHCGRCGHSCVGGECLDGVCQPMELAKVTDGAWGLAVGSSAVCVAIQLNNTMTCLDKQSGAALWESDSPTVMQPSWVAMDSTTVFWSNRVTSTGSIAQCSISSCTTPTKVITPANRPNGVAVTDTHLYWAETSGKTVKRALKDGSGVETIVPSTLDWSPFLLTLHGGYVYFSERAGGRVSRVPLAGGDVQVLGTSSQPSKIAVTQDWVFWTETSSAGRIYRVPNDDPPDGGNAPEIFASLQNTPFGIAADEEHVYWIASASWVAAEGALRACPISGCQGGPIELDTALPYPTDVVMDDQALYYSVFGIDSVIDGAVRKVAKL